MIEAMYGVEFLTKAGNSGYGVAVLETCRIFGGDSSMTYIGDYSVENGRVKASVKVTNDRGVNPSIFGDNAKQYTLELEGEVEDSEIVLQGHRTDDKTKEIGIRLTRRCELP